MPHRILVVDDDPNTTRLVRLYLQRDGHVVSTAADGLEALQIAREKHPDLIVLDIMMPKMDGVELCRVLRQESDVPIIMLTGFGDMMNALGEKPEVDAVLSKPITGNKLFCAIAEVVK